MKSRLARWFSVSVVALSAFAVGCGSRSDGRPNGAQVQAPAACVPPPAGTLPAPAATVAAAASTSAPTTAPAVKDAAKAADAKRAKVSAADAPLKVKRLVVTEAIARKSREPLGEKTSFKADDTDKIYAFVEVENPAEAESEVFVTFEPQGDGASQGQVSLHVGASPRWRTWAFTRNAKKAGQWAAVVRDADGKVLAKKPFEVTL